MLQPHTTEESLRQAAWSHPSRKLRNAWGAFVAQWQWEWFVSLTFAYDTHPERATKLFRVWASKLSKELYGPRWHKREPYGVVFVLATEFQKSGRVHLHALMAGVGPARRLSWMDYWVDLDAIAGFARIEPVHNQNAVSNYVTKYVSKDGEVEFSRNLRQRHPELFDWPATPESGT